MIVDGVAAEAAAPDGGGGGGDDDRKVAARMTKMIAAASAAVFVPAAGCFANVRSYSCACSPRASCPHRLGFRYITVT